VTLLHVRLFFCIFDAFTAFFHKAHETKDVDWHVCAQCFDSWNELEDAFCNLEANAEES